MKKIFPSLFLLIMTVFSSQAKTWQVGPGRVFAIPSLVSTLVKDGDSVAIDSGLYTQDVAHWTANNLVITGVKGNARLNGNGTTYGGKAIWVIGGNNVTIQHIEFYGASCVDHNGAGIRAEGTNLTVQHCYFHDNQDGILAGDNANSDILIEYCSFRHNGYGDGYSHNLYINHVHKLTFQYNLSHLANVGHELKSRALNNYILYNRFSDETTGTASRSIDLPNGGFSVILGNVIEKGPNAQNSNFLEYGLEGLTNPDSEIYIVNNTFVNDHGIGIYITVQNGTTLCKAYNNIFAGPGIVLTGSAAKVDTSHNIVRPIKEFSFIPMPNGPKYYYIFYRGPAFQAGTDPGKAGNFSLIPGFEYSGYYDSAAVKTRYQWPILDCGAFSHVSAGIETTNKTDLQYKVFPNPSNGKFNIEFKNAQQNYCIELIDYNGKTVLISAKDESSHLIEIPTSALPEGLYLLRIGEGENSSTRKILIVH